VVEALEGRTLLSTSEALPEPTVRFALGEQQPASGTTMSLLAGTQADNASALSLRIEWEPGRSG
jgi:hypothetical protein